MANRLVLLLGALGVLGCTQTTLTSHTLAVEPPACTTIGQFGNGQACSSSDGTLAVCGTNPARLCAAGWLCYDDVGYAQCACQSDADCAGKREYVNTARALNNKSPVGITCIAARCVESN